MYTKQPNVSHITVIRKLVSEKSILAADKISAYIWILPKTIFPCKQNIKFGSYMRPMNSIK